MNSVILLIRLSIPNQSFFQSVDRNTSLIDAFKTAMMFISGNKVFPTLSPFMVLFISVADVKNHERYG